MTLTVWATPDDARAFWPDSDTVDPDTLQSLLNAATTVCQRFADPDVTDLPEYADNRRQSVVLQARQLWTAYRRDGDVLSFDTYAVRVRALSSDVQSLLRPSPGRPMVG